MFRVKIRMVVQIFAILTLFFFITDYLKKSSFDDFANLLFRIYKKSFLSTFFG